MSSANEARSSTIDRSKVQESQPLSEPHTRTTSRSISIPISSDLATLQHAETVNDPKSGLSEHKSEVHHLGSVSSEEPLPAEDGEQVKAGGDIPQVRERSCVKPATVDEATDGLAGMKLRTNPGTASSGAVTDSGVAKFGPSPPAPPPKDEIPAPAKSPLDVQLAKEDKQTGQEWDEKQEYEERISQPRKASPFPGGDFDEKARDGEGAEAKPEIENIMRQFGVHQGSELSAMFSPSGSELPVFQYPLRSSSLQGVEYGSTSSAPGSPQQLKASSISSKHGADTDSTSISTPSVVSAPPPPEPDPEPDLPFDFHRFLEQLRHRTADPVAKFLRSFLLEFGKKQWQVHEQVKIITDFLTFISGKMAQCEIWRSVSEAEFDNAREGMEKLVMNRLYNQTFSPEIPPAELLPGKTRRKGSAVQLGPGRKGQHEEDVERDEVLAQKVRIYGWITEEHLDIRPFGDKGKKFLSLAQQELTKIKAYRAPRDKIICVLNCCKVIFGYLRNAHSDQSADAFIPLLIYTVLKANPEHLVSNVQYILRFRSQDKLTGEAGYYMSSLMGAVQFIENLDRTNITISDAEFEANVEAAVSSIAEPHRRQQSLDQEKRASPQPSAHPSFAEKSSLSRAEVTPRHSLEGERSGPRRGSSRQADPSSGDESDEKAAVSGLLRSIQKPLSTIGRIFSEEPSTSTPPSRPPSAPHPSIQTSRPPRTSSILPTERITTPKACPPQMGDMPLDAGTRSRITAEEVAARHTSAETAQAQRVTRAEHKTIVETLAGMFPDLDRDVISDVVRVKEGRVGHAVDACLALSR